VDKTRAQLIMGVYPPSPHTIPSIPSILHPSHLKVFACHYRSARQTDTAGSRMSGKLEKLWKNTEHGTGAKKSVEKRGKWGKME